MDGFKRRLNSSVQFKLSFWLLLTIILSALIASTFSFLSSFDEAHEMQDDMLHQVAALFDRQEFGLAKIKSTNHTKNSDEVSPVIVQYLEQPNSPQKQGDADLKLSLPVNLLDGLQILNVNGEEYRVLVKTTSGGERIAVAQETAIRDEMAHDSALRTLMPFLILIPILLLIVANLVRKIFRPIFTLSAEIDNRTEKQLFPVETSHLPVEVRPFVVAINRLLVRIDQSMDKQRRFIADAAHELRSPLTALSLQAERLEQADMSALARERLTTLHKGILRGRRLLDQLLTLATVQATIDQPKSSVSVQGVYRSVLEDFMPIAELKNLDIGVEEMQDLYLWINELDLRTVVKNLVDNAVRYTPNGGRVDLSVFERDGCVTLKIQDTGPGITTGERRYVFDPFYRTLGSDQIGSGLGLSIVKAITDRIGAQITLGFSDELTASGLRVCILFFR